MFEDVTNKLKGYLIRFNRFYYDHFLTIHSFYVLFIVAWVWVVHPELRWIFPYALLAGGAVLLLLMVISCPLIIIITGVAIILWIYENIEERILQIKRWGDILWKNEK